MVLRNACLRNHDKKAFIIITDIYKWKLCDMEYKVWSFELYKLH